jgi:hypothetical protein
MSTDSTAGGHPDAEDMAAYLDGRATESARERIEAHAAACPECRREIAEVTAMLWRTREQRRWRVWAPTATAAAAVAALLIFRPFAVDPGPDRQARFRGPDSGVGEGFGEIRVASPSEEGALDLDGLMFVWHTGAPGASYQLTVTDEEGGVVWTLATTDTVAPLPDAIELEPASTYYWYVDALLEDGGHATTGVHSFTTRR